MSSENIDTLKKDYDSIKEQLQKLKESSKSESQKKSEAEILKKKADETKTKIQSEILSSKIDRTKALSYTQKIEDVERMINSVSKEIDALYNEIVNQHLSSSSTGNKNIFKSIGGWISAKILQPIGRFFKNLFWWWKWWDNSDNNNENQASDQTTENGGTSGNIRSDANLRNNGNWVENESTLSEKLKCKWWEYLWIDISSYNGTMNLSNFKNRNRTQRDSVDKKDRWISLMYIRASDHTVQDSKVDSHVDNVCNYNKQVKDDEKIAVGFYHRLSWADWKQQADTFIKTYMDQNAKLWSRKLIPMIDVEDGKSGEGRVTNAQKNQNKKLVADKTFEWINYVEKKLWVTPWIYVNDSVYSYFFSGDNRFNKYKRRIARYWNKPSQSDMHQYTDKWKVGWFTGTVDLNSTKDVRQFLA